MARVIFIWIGIFNLMTSANSDLRHKRHLHEGARSGTSCSRVVPSRLEIAKELGATHVVNSKQTDPVAEIREITGGVVDFSLEATGRTDVLRQSIEALEYLGTCGIVGAAPLGAESSFEVDGIMLPGKSIRGILQSESIPDLSFRV